MGPAGMVIVAVGGQARTSHVKLFGRLPILALFLGRRDSGPSGSGGVNHHNTPYNIQYLLDILSSQASNGFHGSGHS